MSVSHLPFCFLHLSIPGHVLYFVDFSDLSLYCVVNAITSVLAIFEGNNFRELVRKPFKSRLRNYFVSHEAMNLLHHLWRKIPVTSTVAQSDRPVREPVCMSSRSVSHVQRSGAGFLNNE